MSTERTFYEEEDQDIFINQDVITGEIFVYKNYLQEDAVELEITKGMLEALVELATDTSND